MFTGLVQAIGTVAACGRAPTGNTRLVIDKGPWPHTPAHGDSIAVAGVCLTLVTLDGPRMAFDVIPETLRKTRLGTLKPGDPVNLEHAATMSTLMGGHLVQGHVDAVAGVTRIARTNDDHRIEIAVSTDLADCIIDKGSICVDGVSLTVAGLTSNGFTVALIPTTLELTTLRHLKAGDEVNLEVDMMAKAVVHIARQYLSRRPASA